MNLPELYDFQREATNHALRNNPDMIVIPTGEGKTICALYIADKLLVPTIVITPTIELVKQWDRVIKQYGGECTTYASGTEKEFSDFTVITYASILLHLDELRKYELIIFDEVHHLFADEYQKIGEVAISMADKGVKVVGLTASPRTRGKEELIQNVFFPHRYVRTISQRQKSDRAVDLSFIPEEVSFSESEMKEYNANWDTYVKWIKIYGGFRNMMVVPYPNDGRIAYQKIKKMLTENRDKVARAINIILSHPEGKFVVFADTIRVVDAMNKVLNNHGVTSVKIHSRLKGKKVESQSRKEREKIIEDLKNGNARVLLGCNAIEEGIDLPDMDNAIFLSNFSSSSRKIIQRAGRAMRSVPGKDVKIYVIYIKKTKEEENLESIKRILGVN